MRTCIDCGKITAGESETDLYICPECWAKFRGLNPQEQLQDLIKRLGGERGLQISYGGFTDNGNLENRSKQRLPQAGAEIRV